MKTACTLVLCLVVALQFSAASAQVYQWKDKSGRTIISDTPPPTTAKGRAIDTAPAADSGAAAPKTAAEKDMDFKKRQQEAKQKADKEAKDADRKDNCERARQHLATLESGERLSIRDESGERRIMEDDQRQQEIERVRRVLAESCK